MTVCTQQSVLSLAAGHRLVRDSWLPLSGVSMQYLFTSGLVAGVNARLEYSEPTRVYRSAPFASGYLYDNGQSSVMFLSAEAGWRIGTQGLWLAAGVKAGGVNVSHRRIVFMDEDVTIANPSLMAGAWSTLSYKATDAFGLSVRADYDAFDASRIIGRSAFYSSEYTAVFARSGPSLMLGLQYYPGEVRRVSEIDSASWRWFFATTFASLHPFTQNSYNQFNPGVGLHVRTSNCDSPTFYEAGMYQYSLSDRAIYAGGGYLWNFYGSWIKWGILGGVLVQTSASHVRVVPALSPRLMFDTPFGSACILFIPVWTESAFGFQYMLPIH